MPEQPVYSGFVLLRMAGAFHGGSFMFFHGGGIIEENHFAVQPAFFIRRFDGCQVF